MYIYIYLDYVNKSNGKCKCTCRCRHRCRYSAQFLNRITLFAPILEVSLTGPAGPAGPAGPCLIRSLIRSTCGFVVFLLSGHECLCGMAEWASSA